MLKMEGFIVGIFPPKIQYWTVLNLRVASTQTGHLCFRFPLRPEPKQPIVLFLENAFSIVRQA